MKKTARGFQIYAEFKDTRGCDVRVQESSADPLTFVWVFCHNTSGAYHNVSKEADVSPHLNIAQAKRLIKGLQAFVADKTGEPPRRKRMAGVRTQMTHSKGPWVFDPMENIDPLTGEYREPEVCTEENELGESFTIATVRIGLEGTTANGHLISAAPDLLEALKVAKNSVECASINIHDGEELPWYRMAKKAIAKAEGRDT